MTPPDIRVRAVLHIVDKVEQDDGVPSGPQQEGRQPPVEAGALGESNQLRFQLGTALDEIRRRQLTGTLTRALYVLGRVQPFVRTSSS
ncbi:hypothetical protein [Streptomyces atroolivaceus]|uniref:hypothetical protein n=1 Tax=Streptomyces atroolivaceus TaxID=66869 RepID=UPI0020243496|nr:hypothetical protein [Streptomyces atroolivaceus]